MRFFRLAALFIVGLGMLSACNQPALDSSSTWQQWGTLESESLDEISGLARSLRNPTLFWGHNDSGNGAYVYAFNQQGLHQGRLNLIGVGNRDWEDMASFHWQGQAWLLLADVGDNQSQHPELRLQLVGEPQIKKTGASVRRAPKASYRFVYPDGPRDSESIAVDISETSVYILSKRDVPARLYRLPLSLEDNGQTQTAEFLGTVPQIPQPSIIERVHASPHGRWSAQPTAFDFAPDRSSAAVLTYKSVFIFPRTGDQTWAEALAAQPIEYPLPRLKQAESLVYVSPNEVLVSSEKHPAPLWLLTFP